MRFIGCTVYDALINWDLTQGDAPSELVPGPTTEWSTDIEDRTHWTLTRREGVTFHDGSPLTAETVAWNFDKLFDNEAEQYDPRQSAQGRSRMPAAAS